MFLQLLGYSVCTPGVEQEVVKDKRKTFSSAERGKGIIGKRPRETFEGKHKNKQAPGIRDAGARSYALTS